MISERIFDDIPPQIKFLNMVIPKSNALLQFCSELESWKPHKTARHPTKCDVINDVKLFPTVYHRIYCRKVLTLYNQTSRYKIKCIRIVYKCWLLPHDGFEGVNVYITSGNFQVTKINTKLNRVLYWLRWLTSYKGHLLTNE